MEKTLEFTLVLKEIPVKMKGADGKVRDYKLVELDAEDRDKFLNSLGGRIKYVNGKPQGMSNYEGLQASLLSRCLYNDEGNLVPQKEIQKFPAGVASALFKEAQKLSAFDEEAAEESKNG
jgi:hypothetical protein